jgi:WD40 repeat protein
MHPLEELEAALLRVAVSQPENLPEMLRRDARGLVRAVEAILPEGRTDIELMLFIDQFEEAFTLAEESETAWFLDLLAHAVTEARSPLRIVITLRADFYDRPLMHPAFSDLMSKRTAVVVPLTRTELQNAVVSPAETVGVAIEAELVQKMIGEVQDEPGVLPLLQYALTELFDRHDGRTITLADYTKIGGVLGALARRADELYNSLSPEGQRAAKQLFLRLVTLGEGTEDTRRRVAIAELLSIASVERAEMQDVIDIFGKYRLLTFDRDPQTRVPTVEVAHEAIIREWQHLREWLDSGREDVRQQRRLSGLMREWQEAKRDPSFLLRGVQLEQFEYWLSTTDLALASGEREYFDASIAAREAAEARERARIEREEALERRALVFQRRLLVVMSIATVLALLLTAFAFNQREEARLSAATATVAQGQALIEADNAATAAAVAGRRADELQSLSLAESAEDAFAENNTDLALSLALQANTIFNPPVRAQRVLSELLSFAAVNLFSGEHTDRVNAVAFSPNGLSILSASNDGTLVLWDANTGLMQQRYAGVGVINSLAFLPDGENVLLATGDGALLLFNLTDGTVTRHFEGHDDAVFSVVVSADGTLALSGSRDRTLILWDVATGQALRRFGSTDGSAEGHLDRITAVAMTPDARYGLSGSADNTLILWDLNTGTIVQRFVGHTNVVTSVAISPDGLYSLSGSVDTTLILWDLSTGELVRRFEGHLDRVTSVAFSPDGLLALSGSGSPFAGASNENIVILWDVQTGLPVARFTGHSGQVTSVAFNGGAPRLTAVSGSADTTLRTWAVEPDMELLRLTADAGITDVALSSDGAMILTATTQNTLVLWDLRAMSPIREFSGHEGRINAVAISPDNAFALTASDDRTLMLWNLANGEAVRTFSGHTNQVRDVVFSPDGTLALSGSRDRNLILWDVATGEIVRTFETRHTNWVNTVALSPDGTRALSGSSDGTMILWDVATGTALMEFDGHEDDVASVVFSPDGLYGLSGSNDKTLILWDLSTGAIVRRFGAPDVQIEGGHTDWVTSVAFSPDGRMVISGSRDRSVRVWNVSTGELIYVFAPVSGMGGHTEPISAVLATPDGRNVLSVSLDGTLRLFPLAVEVVIDWTLAHRYVRELNCDERAQFRIEPACPTEESTAAP